MLKKTTIIGLLAAMMIISAVNVSGMAIITSVKNDDGTYVQDSLFTPSDPVFAAGSGYTGVGCAGDTILVYITADKSWSDTDPIILASGTIATPITLTEGSFSETLIWASPTPGKYDIIADDNCNGVYDKGTDGVDDFGSIGFTVLPELSTVVLMGAGLVSMIGYVGINRRHRI